MLYWWELISVKRIYSWIVILKTMILSELKKYFKNNILPHRRWLLTRRRKSSSCCWRQGSTGRSRPPTSTNTPPGVTWCSGWGSLGATRGRGRRCRVSWGTVHFYFFCVSPQLFWVRVLIIETLFDRAIPFQKSRIKKRLPMKKSYICFRNLFRLPCMSKFVLDKKLCYPEIGHIWL